MAQYDKLINLGLLSQFLTKAKTIFAPKITASGILKGDGAGNVSAATAGTDYVTPAQSLTLGLAGASVGDLVRVNAVDSNGRPTSWEHVPLNEIKCNKNLLDNWYFIGGGSQLGDGVFPINQRGQTTYSGAGYCIDRWRNNNTQFNVDITSSAIKLYGTNYGNTILQYISNASALLGKTITISAIINGILSYTSFKLPDELPASGTVGSGTIPDHDGINAYLRVLNNKLCFVFFASSSYVAETVINITAAKLELGSEQTLCHNEGTEQNPVWVLNEIPYYETELLRCISSHADTSDNFANKDYASALKVGPRIESGDNVDNYRYLYQAGTYAIASGVTNSPESWSIMLVIPSPSGGCRQIAFGGSKIYLRAYSGSPLAWSAWKSITLS